MEKNTAQGLIVKNKKKNLGSSFFFTQQFSYLCVVIISHERHEKILQKIMVKILYKDESKNSTESQF
jgi:hypothetical protein